MFWFVFEKIKTVVQCCSLLYGVSALKQRQQVSLFLEDAQIFLVIRYLGYTMVPLWEVQCGPKHEHDHQEGSYDEFGGNGGNDGIGPIIN